MSKNVPPVSKVYEDDLEARSGRPFDVVQVRRVLALVTEARPAWVGPCRGR
jgi:hypothetical protein